jgi:hypothetical protein
LATREGRFFFGRRPRPAIIFDYLRIFARSSFPFTLRERLPGFRGWGWSSIACRLLTQALAPASFGQMPEVEQLQHSKRAASVVPQIPTKIRSIARLEPRLAGSIEPVRIAVFDGVELALERIGVGLAAGIALAQPFGQRPVRRAAPAARAK